MLHTELHVDMHTCKSSPFAMPWTNPAASERIASGAGCSCSSRGAATPAWRLSQGQRHQRLGRSSRHVAASKRRDEPLVTPHDVSRWRRDDAADLGLQMDVSPLPTPVLSLQKASNSLGMIALVTRRAMVMA